MSGKTCQFPPKLVALREEIEKKKSAEICQKRAENNKHGT